MTHALTPGIERDRLREGLIATARIVLIGLSMDVIYQYKAAFAPIS